MLTLIVATRNRQDSLRRLLSRLQLHPGRAWEVIVVDNSGEEAELLPDATQASGVQIVREPRRGKGNALNKGIEAARGELLVFTDDDIEPEPAWLDELAAASLRHPDADTFGGKILSRAPSVPAWIRRSRNLQEILLTEHDLGQHEQRYPPNRYPQGPNMAVRRRALAGIGVPWDPQLGPGSSIPVGDEKCFFLRINQGGGRKRVYVPTAVVHHLVEGRELGLLTALRRCYLGGYTGGLLQSRFAAQLEQDNRRQGIVDLLSQTRSLRELACVLVRAFGFYRGRLAIARPPATEQAA